MNAGSVTVLKKQLHQYLFRVVLFLPLLTACKPHLNADKLYGTWKYIKIDHPKSDDAADTVTNDELQTNHPTINFSRQQVLTIVWGGKVLSRGTFVLDGNNIQYTEQLGGGKTRTFPFWVSQLDNKKFVFETLDKNGSRVAAVKN